MPAALLNIAALSRRTGVAADTLRKWEQRYGVLRPERTAGGQRRYSDADVQRVEWLRDRINDGWRIGEAARVLDGAETAALDDPADLRESLIAAVQATEPQRVAATLDQAFSVLPLAQALTDVVTPALRWAGEAWHRGELSIAQEHAISAKVRLHLGRLLADGRGGVRGTAVLACAPGEQHDIGLMMLAVMLRADGWRVEYLGADTPVEAALDFAAEIGATVLCISAALGESVRNVEVALASIERPRGIVLVLGGTAVDARIARGLEAIYADSELDVAVARLRRLSPTG